MAKNIAEYYFGTDYASYVKTIDDKLITVGYVGNDIEILTDDVKDFHVDASFTDLGAITNLFVIKNDNSFWGMGGNATGRLGDGTYDHRDEFVKIADDAVYGLTFAYLSSDGTLYRWTEDDLTHRPFPDAKFKYLGYDYLDYAILIDTDGFVWTISPYDNDLYKQEPEPSQPYENLILPSKIVV
jgi:hypothetical protein